MKHPEEVERTPELVSTAHKFPCRRRQIERRLVPPFKLGTPQRGLATSYFPRNLSDELQPSQSFRPGEPVLGRSTNFILGGRPQSLSAIRIEEVLAGRGPRHVHGTTEEPGQANLLNVRLRFRDFDRAGDLRQADRPRLYVPDEMVAVDDVDVNDSHVETGERPDQSLDAHDQSKPLVGPARQDMGSETQLETPDYAAFRLRPGTMISNGLPLGAPARSSVPRAAA